MQRSIAYYVQNPKTNIKKGRAYPLISVVAETLPEPVVTKTGAIGAAVRVTLSCIKEYSAEAVYHPEEDHPYSFYEGAKIALERALAKSGWSKDTKKSVWDGFFYSFGREF